MRKLFQWHRGGLKEALETQVEVKNFTEIEAIVAKHCEEIHMPNVYYIFRQSMPMMTPIDWEMSGRKHTM